MVDKKKIMVVEAQNITRYCLCKSLEQEKEFSVVRNVNNGRAAVKMALQLCPDVVIMGVDLPGLNGIQATQQIITGNSDICVIALSMVRNQQCVMGMFNAGARAFLLKNCTFLDLQNAIRAVCQGKKYLSTDIAGMMVDMAMNPSHATQTNGCKTLLTTRELEVLQLLAEGNTSLNMAKILDISKRTVDIHRKNIMDKLNLRNVAQLTKYAIAEGIIFI